MKLFSIVLKYFELILKVLISLSVAFLVLLCFVFWRGGHFVGYGEENLPIHSFYDNGLCVTENEKLIVIGEDVRTSFFRVFINGPYGIYRVYKIFYVNSNDEKIHLATYEFPLTLGIGAVIEHTEIFVENNPEVLKIYYSDAPVNGFTIIKNPFSKKIQFVYKHDLHELHRTCIQGNVGD